MEQESAYTVQVGIQKGDALVFGLPVFATDGTASKLIMPLEMVCCLSWVTIGTGEGSNLDYRVVTANVEFRTGSPPDNVIFFLNVDNIALESSETFSLKLNATAVIIIREGIFVRDTLNVTIVDSDGE